MSIKTLDVGFDNRLKNYLMNGAFQLWQRGGSFANATSTYHADRWFYGTLPTGRATISQNADLPTGAGTSGGFSYNIQVTTAQAVLGVNDNTYVYQPIEGYFFNPIRNKVCYFGLWVKSNKPGPYAAFLVAGSPTTSTMIKAFTINQADTWEFKKFRVDFSAETTATYSTTNGKGMVIGICTAAGSTKVSSTTDQWMPILTGATGVTGQNNLFDSTANYLRIAYPMLNEGNDAAPFELCGRHFAEELQLCQRYYEKSYDLDIAPGTISDVNIAYARQSGAVGLLNSIPIAFSATKRAIPTVVLYNPKAANTTGVFWDYNTSGNRSYSTGMITLKGCVAEGIPGSAGSAVGGHWTAEIEL